MNQNFQPPVRDSLRQSGRTTRMLQYVIAEAFADQPMMIVCNSVAHTLQMMLMFKALVPEGMTLKTLPMFISISDLARRGYGNPHLLPGTGTRDRVCGFNYKTARMEQFVAAGEQTPEIVFDHYALEVHLQNITQYLKRTREMGVTTGTLIDTARLMSLQGRTYLLTHTANVRFYQILCEDYNVSVEDGFMLDNLDWLKLKLDKMWPGTSLVFDPVYLEMLFEGSLKEIHRWDHEEDDNGDLPCTY